MDAEDLLRELELDVALGARERLCERFRGGATRAA